jgi:nucleoid-associated protein YgaU
LILTVLAAAAISAGALAGLAPAPAQAPAAASSQAGSTVVVQAGDTLWSIARQLEPTGDVRPVVDQLVELNGSAPLQPGQRVVVPG